MLTACSSSVNDSHKKETGTNQSETTSSPFETVEITSEEKNTEIMDEEPEDIKIAVVYFSGTGNTKAIAEVITDEAGADIYEIVPAQTYTDEDLNLPKSKTTIASKNKGAMQNNGIAQMGSSHKTCGMCEFWK